MRHRSLMNEPVTYWRESSNSLRELTAKELDWWFDRLRKVHERRGDRSMLFVGVFGRDYLVNRVR